MRQIAVYVRILTAANTFICAAIGVVPESRKETAQYLNGWMRGMRDDKQAVVRAFSHAQRAADFILKETPSHEPEPARPEGHGADAREPVPT
jgi:antirestriction protein ArdC